MKPLKDTMKRRVIEQAAIYCQKLVPLGVIVCSNAICIDKLRLTAPSLQIAQEDAGEGASIESGGDRVNHNTKKSRSQDLHGIIAYQSSPAPPPPLLPPPKPSLLLLSNQEDPRFQDSLLGGGKLKLTDR